MTTPAEKDRMHELETENRHLKDTIYALREALEEAETECQERVQKALVTANDEIAQLKATIPAIRDEMDRKQVGFEEALQASHREARDETAELQKTIQALRDQLEEANG